MPPAASASQKAADDGSWGQIPTMHMADTDGILGSWFSLAQASLQACEEWTNQELENWFPSVSVPLLNNF